MYVCICKAVTDSEIRGAVKLGVRSLADLSASLGVATCCGRCSECARSVLSESLLADCAPAGCGDD
jgi:bacterioferritin-associated ferredoxin